jgi:outer membrane protein OmpA-like peptidoglycan-associated protein
MAMYDYDDDYDEVGGWSLGRTVAIVIGVVAVAALGWFVVRPGLTDGENATGGTIVPAVSTTTTEAAAESSEPSTTEASTTRSRPTTTDRASAANERSSRTTVAATTTAPTTTVTPTTAAPLAPAAPVPYETLPDGTPAPVVGLFDVESITLTGAVPDQAAKDRLQALAIANAKPGQATNIANFLTINPAVPRSVGVRVVELTSVRFPEGSAEVLPPHALELDRAVGIMNALPHITALVIGHADQRGDELVNYTLSEQRANAVRDYMVGRGIAPSRLSSRAVGEADLLTLNNDDAALALNRRTEFVFYGLLIE